MFGLPSIDLKVMSALNHEWCVSSCDLTFSACGKMPYHLKQVSHVSRRVLVSLLCKKGEANNKTVFVL